MKIFGMLVSHVRASSLFVFFGMILAISGVRPRRLKPQLPLLVESPANAFCRGYYLPARRETMMDGPALISIGSMAVAHSIQIY